MSRKYAIQVTEQNSDLIMFLNDGVRPIIEEKSTYFIFEIIGPREIKGKIEYENALYYNDGHAKPGIVWL
jgi:hypothetical protein